MIFTIFLQFCILIFVVVVFLFLPYVYACRLILYRYFIITCSIIVCLILLCSIMFCIMLCILLHFATFVLPYSILLHSVSLLCILRYLLKLCFHDGRDTDNLSKKTHTKSVTIENTKKQQIYNQRQKINENTQTQKK